MASLRSRPYQAFCKLLIAIPTAAVLPQQPAQTEQIPCFCYHREKTKGQELRCAELGINESPAFNFAESCSNSPIYPFKITQGSISDPSGFLEKAVTISASDRMKLSIRSSDKQFSIRSFQIVEWSTKDSRALHANPSGAAKGAIVGWWLLGLPGALVGADLGKGGQVESTFRTLIVYKDKAGETVEKVVTLSSFDDTNNLRGFLEESLKSNRRPQQDMPRRLKSELVELEQIHDSLAPRSPRKPWCPGRPTDKTADQKSARIREQAAELVTFAKANGIILESHLAESENSWIAHLKRNPSLNAWAAANPAQAINESKCEKH